MTSDRKGRKLNDNITKPAQEALGVIKRCDDQHDVLNGPEYHTGKLCIVNGCAKPAGTAWGPHWCQQHNSERLQRVTKSLERLANE